jgi:hypothetical protein
VTRFHALRLVAALLVTIGIPLTNAYGSCDA